MSFEKPQDVNNEQISTSPEKEAAKQRFLQRFNALQDNEFGLKAKAGIRVLLGALSQRDREGKFSLQESFDDFVNRWSRDSETGHIDAVGGPKNPDMHEWLNYNEYAVDTLRQIAHDNVVEVGKNITAAEAYDLVK